MLILLSYVLLFLLAVLLFKSVLFWVYFWQLKEYRWDRLLAEFDKPEKFLKFWVFSGGRKFWKPVGTPKAVLIFLTALIIAGFLTLLLILKSGSPAVYPVIYFSAPIIVAITIFLFKIPTYFLKQLVFNRASKKIDAIKDLTVIGITGSYGKSSTKEFVSQILSLKFRVAKTPLNVNTEIGIAKFILKELPGDTQVFVVEMGAYKKGEIKRICEIVKPKIGILTGISPQHLALFGSLENIKQAKFELIESLPSGGLAIFNGENKETLALSQRWTGKKVLYKSDNSLAAASTPSHYRLNLGAAIETAGYLGLTEEEIKKAVKDIKLEGNFIKSFAGLNGALIIDDTYSANPDGALAALDYLAIQPQSAKIIIMPCLIELGKTASEIHQKIGRKIKEVCDQAIITTESNFKDIQKEAGNRARLMENSDRIKEFLQEKLSSDWAVLLEGRIAPGIIDGLKK